MGNVVDGGSGFKLMVKLKGKGFLDSFNWKKGMLSSVENDVYQLKKTFFKIKSL